MSDATLVHMLTRNHIETFDRIRRIRSRIGRSRQPGRRQQLAMSCDMIGRRNSPLWPTRDQ
jgi:hypothetical protein